MFTILQNNYSLKSPYKSSLMTTNLLSTPTTINLPIPTVLAIPRLKKKMIENVQKYMETSKKDRLHFLHHNFIPNSLKINRSARTTVIQIFRTSSPFTLEVAFGHTVKDILHLHIIDGRANIRCSRDIDNTINDIEAKFTSSWAISKDLLDYYRVTIRPLMWPLLLIMEEIHPEAPCPLPAIWPFRPTELLPEKTDNQNYAFISARFAYMEEKTFPLSITVIGADGTLLLNTIVCPRDFIKHYAGDTHNLKEDDIMRGLDHYVAYPLLKSILKDKTIIAYNARKVMDGLMISLTDIHTYIEVKNLLPTTSHYTEFRLQNLAKTYIPTMELPVFPIKTTMIEATLIQKIFTAIKTNFVISSTSKNPYTHLVKNMKDQDKTGKIFKLPDVPRISKTIYSKSRTTVPPLRRKTPPQEAESSYPPKNRKVVIEPEDLFAELDDRQYMQQDTRTVHLADRPPVSNPTPIGATLLPDKPTTSNRNPFQRPTKSRDFIPVKSTKDTSMSNVKPKPSDRETTEIREKRKPESKTPLPKETPPPVRPTGPQKVLVHPFALIGLTELNTESFLSNLEAAALKKEACTSSHLPQRPDKEDPAEKRLEQVRQYVTKREKTTPDPGTPSVIANGYYARATADYDDSRYTWDYFIYVQYFNTDHPKSLTYNNIPAMPKLPDCGIMEILYVPVRYRGYPVQNLQLISSHVIREYRDARKIRTYSLFTRTVQPPLIS